MLDLIGHLASGFAIAEALTADEELADWSQEAALGSRSGVMGLIPDSLGPLG